MTDRPIIFSAPMVRALLDGRKSMTRRVLNPQPEVGPLSSEHLEDHELRGWHDLPCGDEWATVKRLPYAPGDRLYVREACAIGWCGENPSHVWYRADGEDKHPEDKWHPSIHMPRWASRLTLTVTEVRVQRLQEISAADSIAEGVQCATCEAMKASACHRRGCFASIDAYRTLWNSLHGPDAWATNPWICAISFTVQKGNIDGL